MMESPAWVGAWVASLEARYTTEEVCTQADECAIGDYLDTVLHLKRTYDSVECTPGPHLNLIIGPNGTGKSSIVCGICLGLGGKPNMVGRAGQISDYIKHDTNQALIEIELFNPKGENWIVTREMHQNNNSTWMLNKRQSSQKAVEKLINKLNIQVGNLCQFLPQDRVNEFAKMPQQELLENTEKAVCSSEMFENHVELKKLRAQIRELENSAKSSEDHLEKEKQKITRLEEEEYEEARRQYIKEKQQKEELIKKLKEFREANAPLEQKLEKSKTIVKKLEDEMKTLASSIRNHAQKVSNKTKQIEDYNNRVAEFQDDLRAKKEDEIQRQTRLQAINQQRESLINQLENVTQNRRDIQFLLDEINKQAEGITQSLKKVQSEKENCKLDQQSKEREIRNVEQELQRRQDVARIRYSILHQKHRNAFEAANWLRQNRNKFQKYIYEPIMTQINVTDQCYAKYVEMHIPYNDMVAFVCEDKEDLKKFMNIVSDELKLRVNAVLAPSVPLESFQPSTSLNYLSKWGFHHFLKDLFSAPEPVLKYLCQLYRIHDIPVGDKFTQENIESILNNTKLFRFYTETHMYSIRHSRYADGAKSTMSTEVKKPELLTISTDVALLQDLNNRCQILQQQLQQENIVCKKLEQEELQIIEQLNELRNKKRALTAENDMKKNLMTKIKQVEDSIQHMERKAINVEAEEKKVAVHILNIDKKKCNSVVELTNHTKQCIRETMKKTRVSLHHAQALANRLQFEREIQDSVNSIQNMEREVNLTMQSVRSRREEAHYLLAVAKKATGIGTEDELPEQLKLSFSLYPNTLEEINNLIHEQQAKADCLFQTDENIIQQHRRQAHYVDQIEKETTTKKAKLERLQIAIVEVRDRWLPHVEELLSRINENFSHFMNALSCAGEVGLNKSDNPEDFEKYGICIKVKYRDSEQLKELTPYQQSGGERSVATVLYMIALQELTKVPFRCVDEINQGMDSVNERKVFELVVKTACKESSSQYFLLTPKLLPDLKYPEQMCVLLIHNGSTIINHTKWALQKFIKRRSKLQD